MKTELRIKHETNVTTAPLKFCQHLKQIDLVLSSAANMLEKVKTEENTDC